MPAKGTLAQQAHQLRPYTIQSITNATPPKNKCTRNPNMLIAVSQKVMRTQG